MLYRDLITDLANRLKADPNDPQLRTNLGRKVNESYKEVSLSHDWEFLKKTSELLTVPNYVTGTASITNGSRTVTISGGVVTANMAGRYFQPTGDIGKSGNWYRIVAVSTIANTLTLQLPIIETSQGAITYSIWKRFYYLHSEVRSVIDFTKWLENGQLAIRSSQFILDNSNNISTIGVPLNLSAYGVDPFTVVYNIGTISLTQDSQTVTGLGTSFLDNVEPGDILLQSNNEYRVKRVESDTSIILTQYAFATASTVMYSIMKDNPIGIQFYYESDKQYILPYSYYKKVWSMINENNDRPELPEAFDQVILDGAEASRLRETENPKWTTKFQEYTQRVQEIKKRLGYVTFPKYRSFSPFIPYRGGGY